MEVLRIKFGYFTRPMLMDESYAMTTVGMKTSANLMSLLSNIFEVYNMVNRVTMLVEKSTQLKILNFLVG